MEHVTARMHTSMHHLKTVNIYPNLPKDCAKFCKLPGNLTLPTATHASHYCPLSQQSPVWNKAAGSQLLQKVAKGYNAILWSLNFTICRADEAAVYRFLGLAYTIITAATDKFTIVTDSEKTALQMLKRLNKHFIAVHLGHTLWPLGMSTACNRNARPIALSQEAFIGQVVKRFGSKVHGLRLLH